MAIVELRHGELVHIREQYSLCDLALLLFHSDHLRLTYRYRPHPHLKLISALFIA